MLYFAYAADLWAVSLLNWTRGDDHSIVRILSQGPAVLPNHRLAFPTYNATWQGGEASAVASPGKQVSGVLLELPDAALSDLDRRAGRDASAAKDARPQRVTVFPYRGQAVQAMTYQSADDHGGIHVPPTTRYIDRIASAAANARLSTVWIMHLLSFRPLPPTFPTSASLRQTMTYGSADPASGTPRLTVVRTPAVRWPRRARPSRTPPSSSLGVRNRTEVVL